MKKYGLLEAQGADTCVSARAIAILHGQPKERVAALREAAKEVELFAELLETHKDASSDTLKSMLIVQQGFSEDGAEKFIEAFKQTQSFAELSEGDTIKDDDGEEEVDPSDDERGGSGSGSKRKRKKMPGTKEDVFSLSQGDVVLQWPERLTRDEYEDTEGWLNLIKRKLERSVVEDGMSAYGDEGDE